MKKMTNECGVLVGVAVGDAGLSPHMLWRSETERDMGLKVNTNVGPFA
jgi:hypothetical protein